jgi:hypothetical protein
MILIGAEITKADGARTEKSEASQLAVMATRSS